MMLHGADQTGHNHRGPTIDQQFGPSPDSGAFDAWRGHAAYLADVDLIDPADRAGWTTRIKAYTFDDLLYSDVTHSHPQRIHRTPRHVAGGGIDHLLVYFHAEGRIDGSCGDRPFAARPGDISIVDTGARYDWIATAIRVPCRMVPRSKMPPAMLQRRLHGYVLDRDAPVTRLMAGFFRSLADGIDRMTRGEAHAALHALIPLADAVTIDCGKAANSPTRARLTWEERARSFIEARLGRTDLNVDEVARGIGVSRASLYDLFSEAGGVSRYIRERRLQAAFDIIGSWRHDAMPLGAVGLSLGFASEAVFSRSFKERFGFSPRDLRALTREGKAQPLPPLAKGMPPASVAELGTKAGR